MVLALLFPLPLAGHLHAVVALALLAAAAAIIWFFRSRPRWRRIVGGTAVALLLAFATMAFTVHGCMKGTPGLYYLFLLLSVGGVLLLCCNRWLAWPFALALSLGWFVLSNDYTSLVHMDGYVGNPTLSLETGMIEQPTPTAYRASIVSLARQCDEAVAPGDLRSALEAAGIPMSDSLEKTDEPAQTLLLHVAVGEHYRRPVVMWYTPITLLWRVDAVRRTVVSPGGRLSEIADRLEVRESVKPLDGEHQGEDSP